MYIGRIITILIGFKKTDQNSKFSNHHLIADTLDQDIHIPHPSTWLQWYEGPTPPSKSKLETKPESNHRIRQLPGILVAINCNDPLSRGSANGGQMRPRHHEAIQRGNCYVDMRTVGSYACAASGSANGNIRGVNKGGGSGAKVSWLFICATAKATDGRTISLL